MEAKKIFNNNHPDQIFDQNDDELNLNSERNLLIQSTINNDNDNKSRKYAETPLPKLPLLILSIVIISEPFNSTILLPFIYFMVRDFGVSDDDKEIGFYAGLIASSFFFAQFCFSIFWGYMSDKFGRRPILLFGLFGNMVTCFMFGLSKNLLWAIASRSTCGMLNGNIGVAKSMLGPVIGGFLSHPADNFPKIFGNCPFLKSFPYFLPCFVASIVSFIGLIIGYFYLPETRYMHDHQKEEGEERYVDIEDVIGISSRKNLSGNNSIISYGATSNVDSNNGNYNQSPKGNNIIQSYIEEYPCYPETSSSSNLLKGLSKNNVTDIKVNNKQSFIMKNGEESKSKAKVKISRVTYRFYTLYAVAEVKDGGLGYSSIKLAQSLALMGIIQLVSQFLIYPWLRTKVDLIKLYHITLISYVICYLLFPLLNRLKKSFMNLPLESEYGDDDEIVNNSASSETLGTVNGIGQTSSAFVRAIGPASSGSLWSWSLTNNLSFPFNDCFVFIVMSLTALIGSIQSFTIPRELGEI
ncbi:13673_t:CDS:2 [Entrophospora sp. SA101]|nr:13673_t:CDS:2 [Entrophospora sp. SA101]